MPTHDYNIANAAGIVFRADLNDSLSAIVSQNSSATEPTTLFAYMWWADTTTAILKQRNSLNTGWNSLYNLSTGQWLGSTAGNAATVTIADAAADTTTWPMLARSQTGNQAPTTDAGLTYDASTNELSATTFVGALSGNASSATAINGYAQTTATNSTYNLNGAGKLFKARINSIGTFVYADALAVSDSYQTLITGANCTVDYYDGTTAYQQATLTFPTTGTYLVTINAWATTNSSGTNHLNGYVAHAIRVA